MTKTIPARSEIPVAHTWDAASVFPSDEAWEAEIEHLTQQIAQAQKFRGRLGESAATLADWFEFSADIQQRAGKILLYAGMFHHVNTAAQAAAGNNDRGRGMMARAMSAIAFAEPELLEVGFEKLQRWVGEEPRLSHYGHYFDQLKKRKAHVCSSEVEGLLSQTADLFRTATATHGILSDADLVFEPAQDGEGNAHEIGQGNIWQLMNNSDRQLRRSAWEHYADAYLGLKNAMANCIATGVKQQVFLARTRNYNSALEAAVSTNHIPVEVFHNLIATFKKNLPTWHRYWRIRRKALGHEKLHVYDTRAPLTETSISVPIEQAMDWICDGMKPLGDGYVDTMRKGVMEERWVDLYPNKGKRMGAFSTGVRGTHPFIMMSYGNNLLGLSTLAHELGHSMHSYLSWKTQPPVYSAYTIFVAEVASNFNQALVRSHLLETNPDRNFQIQVIEEAMANFHRYFFIMPTLARFELEIHERIERGEALTAESLITLMAELFGEGYGDEVEMDRERVGITWAQFATHLYSNFYVYQYATGISGAHALAKKVLAKAPESVENYLSFLQAGSSLYPLDALKLAGVDLTSPEPVEQTFSALEDYVDRLEQMLE